MTIIGEKLRAAREAKGYTVEHVSRETNIARRYIEALESGDFARFPAEAYLVGFLKNYGEYLSLDVKELQAQYRMHKIQEQPIPVEQLLREPSQAPRVAALVIAGLFAGALIVAAAFYIVRRTAEAPGRKTAAAAKSAYELAEGILEQRLYQGDTVTVGAGGASWTLLVERIGDIITLATPSGEIRLSLNDEARTEAGGAGPLTILASDFLPGKPEAGALLRFELPKAPPAAGLAEAAFAREDAFPPANIPAASQVLFTGTSSYPFTLQLRVQNYCMVRWEVLREANQARLERYFVKGEEMDIPVQNYGVRLWISNAASVKAQVTGGGRTAAVEFGGPGEVVVSDVIWIRDTDGRHKLIQTRLEN